MRDLLHIEGGNDVLPVYLFIRMMEDEIQSDMYK